MGRPVQFDHQALERLRQRIAAAEEANRNLLVLARGQSGAVAAIHGAVIAASDAESFEHLLHIVTQEWPLILGLDAVALALVGRDIGLRADASGIHSATPAMLRRSIERFEPVVLRRVERGHPLFGPACDLIRAEALIRIDGEPPFPSGLLALGQRSEQRLETGHGSELLVFLGRSLASMLRRWIAN